MAAQCSGPSRGRRVPIIVLAGYYLDLSLQCASVVARWREWIDGGICPCRSRTIFDAKGPCSRARRGENAGEVTRRGSLAPKNRSRDLSPRPLRSRRLRRRHPRRGSRRRRRHHLGGGDPGRGALRRRDGQPRGDRRRRPAGRRGLLPRARSRASRSSAWSRRATAAEAGDDPAAPLGQGARAAHRRALGAQHRPAPLRHRHADPALCRRDRRHRRDPARHPQDHPGPARARKICDPDGRRAATTAWASGTRR